MTRPPPARDPIFQVEHLSLEYPGRRGEPGVACVGVLTGRAGCITVVPASRRAKGLAALGAVWLAMLGLGAGCFEAQGVDVEIEVIEDAELGATPPAARRIGADDDHPPRGKPVRSGGPVRR